VIEVRVDDLAFYHGDAIVRPVNAELGATTALMRRLEAAAGERLTSQLRLSEPLAVGSAVVTAAGALDVELMVHAVVCSDDERVTRDSVRRALQSALHQAIAWRLERIALPPLGLGAGNLDIEDSARVMADVLQRHLANATFPRDVVIVAETDDEAAVLRGVLGGRAA